MIIMFGTSSPEVVELCKRLNGGEHMQDKKETEDLKDRLAYEPEEVRRMVEEYNRQKQIEFEDLHSGLYNQYC